MHSGLFAWSTCSRRQVKAHSTVCMVQMLKAAGEGAQHCVHGFRPAAKYARSVLLICGGGREQSV